VDAGEYLFGACSRVEQHEPARTAGQQPNGRRSVTLLHRIDSRAEMTGIGAGQDVG